MRLVAFQLKTRQNARASSPRSAWNSGRALRARIARGLCAGAKSTSGTRTSPELQHIEGLLPGKAQSERLACADEVVEQRAAPSAAQGFGTHEAADRATP
jgi:hypothetical protein